MSRTDTVPTPGGPRIARPPGPGRQIAPPPAARPADTSGQSATAGDLAVAPASAAPKAPKQPSYAYGAIIIDVIDVAKRCPDLGRGGQPVPWMLPMKDPDKHIPEAVTRLMGSFDLAKAGSVDSTAKGQTSK